MIEEQKKIPAVALRGMTVLPEMIVHFDVSRKKSVLAVENAMANEQQIFLVAQKDSNTNDPTFEDVYKYGTIAEIKQVIKLPKDILRVLVVGRKKARLEELDVEADCLIATVCETKQDIDIEEDKDKDKEVENKDNQNETLMLEANVRVLKDLYRQYVSTNPKLKKEVTLQFDDMQDYEKVIHLIAANTPLEYQAHQEILETDSLEAMCELLLLKLHHEVQVQEIKESINQKVKENIDKNQREYILREELKYIKEELGEDSLTSDADEFKNALESLDATEEVKNKIEKEIKRFRSVGMNSAENGVLRTYIETMLEMPWNKCDEEHCDIKAAKEVMNSEHYGLEEVKERLLEFLAVRTLAPKGNAPILCLVGPPGTGKTSIARSLADSLQKQYVRVSLGGVHDEAEIRGHRKTYVGAMPGRIATAIKQANTKNPLILLDEIDKVSSSNKGDTFSALLEVLDAEQNYKFRDHYLEVPLDLSEVLFVATANSLQTIPTPLLDRMEIIEVNSYTENEKVHIAKNHLIPKQIQKHGLLESQIAFSNAVISKIAHSYTREAGVRQLERVIAKCCRKVAKDLLESGKARIRITESNLEKYLGKAKHRYQMRNVEDEIGIVRGLAWTSVGGDTLQIEVNEMPGKGNVILTGKLGDVMKESATIAMSYIRSISDQYEVDKEYFANHDIHVHIPEGAVPKDGPSAGITMATAILSTVIQKPVRADVAMTGEITLRGRVLPIGGLKEKLLAAKNAGIQTVLIPEENKRDLEEFTSEIKSGIEIIPVKHMREVCEIAFAK